MTKLNQIIAIEKGIKSKAHSEASELHKLNQKADLFNGFAKNYQPNDEEGEALPPENKRVQYESREVLRQLERTQTELMEITARKDWTNVTARADVKIDDLVVVAQAPITYLLFLEKQLTDVRTFVANLPVLESSEDWEKDTNSGLFKTKPVKTHRTQTVQKPLVLYHATAEHPAQTQMSTEAVIVGFWTTM